MAILTKPNFFIVGAAKSATTSIYHYLSQHSDVFFPTIKEPKYFSSKYINFPQTGPGDYEFTDKPTIKELKDYLALYKKGVGYKIIGDASVDNLYYYQTAEDIKKFSPDARILIILRNPVDRAFSHYTHFIRDKRETETFKRALELEELRIKSGYEFSWHYRKAGLYYEQVKNYLNVFENNVKVVLFEDINNRPNEILEEICIFLDINYSEINNIRFTKHNTSGNAKNQLFAYLVNSPNFLKKHLKKLLPFRQRSTLKAYFNQINNSSIHLDNPVREELKIYFKEDVNKLQKLINLNLSHWQ